MDFFEAFGASARAPLFLVRLPNKRGDKKIPFRWMRARNADDVRRFIESYDSPGASLYFTVCDVRDGASTRSAETVIFARCVWGEIDFKHHPNLTAEEIDSRLFASPIPPTVIINSGHGRHVYWFLIEGQDLTTPEGRNRVLEAARLACTHIGGDSQVIDVARLHAPTRVPQQQGGRRKPTRRIYAKRAGTPLRPR